MSKPLSMATQAEAAQLLRKLLASVEAGEIEAETARRGWTLLAVHSDTLSGKSTARHRQRPRRGTGDAGPWRPVELRPAIHPGGTEREDLRMPRSLRTNLYRAARTLGNIQAARKGPAAYAKRRVRRIVYRRTNATTRRFLRALGLQAKRRR